MSKLSTAWVAFPGICFLLKSWTKQEPPLHGVLLLAQTCCSHTIAITDLAEGHSADLEVGECLYFFQEYINA